MLSLPICSKPAQQNMTIYMRMTYTLHSAHLSDHPASYEQRQRVWVPKIWQHKSKKLLQEPTSTFKSTLKML